MIHVIYMAAGNSRRFGSNKLLYLYEGKPLYRHGLELLLKLKQEMGEKLTVTVVTQYPEILEEIRSKEIALEMCPTSNRYTRSIENMEDYPLLMYLEKGIRVTVNTDDPAIEGTTISREFRFLKEHFGLTSEQEQAILRNAAEAAFTSDERKHSLYKNICEIS